MSNVVPIGVARRERPPLPADLARYHATHALLFALDNLGDFDEAWFTLALLGFKERALAMAYRNAVLRDELIALSTEHAVDMQGEPILTRTLTDRGRMALAQMNAAPKLRASEAQPAPLPLFAERIGER